MSENADTAAAATRFVVVGVDGSPAARDALRWAAEYAKSQHAQLHAVTAWEWPVSLVVALPAPEGFDPMKEVGGVLETELAEVLGSSPEVTVRPRAICGNPAHVLLEAASGALALVVGSRGHGGFSGLLLGSVSEHCVRHARCPVVVVHHQAA